MNMPRTGSGWWRQVREELGKVLKLDVTLDVSQALCPALGAQRLGSQSLRPQDVHTKGRQAGGTFTLTLCDGGFKMCVQLRSSWKRRRTVKREFDQGHWLAGVTAELEVEL